VNAHCRQSELRAVGCGESLLRDIDRLAEYVAAVAETGATTSVKVRAEVPGVDLVAVTDAVADAGADWLHVDAMDSEGIVDELTAGRATDETGSPRDDLTVIANNGVRGRETVAEYAAYGADAVSVGRPSERPASLPDRRRGIGVAGGRTARGERGVPPGGAAVRPDPVDDATLALLLEVAGTPKPGNVDRHRDLDDLRGSRRSSAGGRRPRGARTGRGRGDGDRSRLRARRRGMAALRDEHPVRLSLLLVPLVRASVGDDGDDENLSPASVDRVTRETTVDDAVAFYRAFEHVDVAVADPPADADDLDVRRGATRPPHSGSGT